MISRCEPMAGSAPPTLPAGFPLSGLLIGLAILGLGLALVVGYRPPWSSAVGLRAAAAEIAAGLREARSEAILRNRPVSLDIDLAGHRFQAGSGRKSGRA